MKEPFYLQSASEKKQDDVSRKLLRDLDTQRQNNQHPSWKTTEQLHDVMSKIDRQRVEHVTTCRGKCESSFIIQTALCKGAVRNLPTTFPSVQRRKDPLVAALNNKIKTTVPFVPSEAVSASNRWTARRREEAPRP